MKRKLTHKNDHGNGITESYYDHIITIWRKNGRKHKEDGPAVKYIGGEQEFWFNGKKHRDGDLPAVVVPYELYEWWFNGKLHRKDGPALIQMSAYASRCKEEWWYNGKNYDVTNAKELETVVLQEQLTQELNTNNTNKDKKIKV